MPQVDQMPPLPPSQEDRSRVPPAGNPHHVTEGFPREQDRAYPGAACADRCPEPSFGPAFPVDCGTTSPGSSSPVGGQM